MIVLSRRLLVAGCSLVGADWLLAGCARSVIHAADRDTAEPQRVAYVTRERPGTIVVDPAAHYLYFVQENAAALRYRVGVGAEGYGWSGTATVHSKQEWPDWYPTNDYLAHRPEVQSSLTELQSGLGMVAGPNNPLGARALYLWQGSKDTLYRIHGTNEPWTIGKDVSAGCIRMTNADIIDLYDRTPIGTKVVVLARHVG